MSRSLEEAVAGIAVIVGLDSVAVASDEHVRSQVYERGIADAEARAMVLKAIGLEPVLPVASAAVVLALEVVKPDERSRWIDALPQGRSREYAATRAMELGVLERLAGDGGAVVTSSEVGTWSLWLQLRLAQRSRSRQLLATLEVDGGSKRVRRIAGDRRGTV